MKLTIFLPLLFWCAVLSGQVLDDFSDQDLSVDPVWTGDLRNFIINDQQELQLNADTGGSAGIFTATDIPPDNLQWSLDCLMDFDPSGSNYLTLFLGLDTTELSIANGFAIVLGESGNEDRLRFYKITSGVYSEIGIGSTLFAIAPQFRIAIRKTGLVWAILTGDSPFAGGYTQEIEIQQSEPLARSGYFGIQCTYTDSRTDKFRFDNLMITAVEAQDTTPPSIVSLEIENSRQLFVQFSEILEVQTAGNSLNYQILPDEVKILQATVLADPSLVQLDLDADLTPDLDYVLLASGVQDPSGNLTSGQYGFTFQPAISIRPYDIVINEIFDDPTPVFGLPEAEYLELLVLKDGINLDQLILSVGDRAVPLPSRRLAKGEFLVIHDLDDAEKFININGSIGVRSLPALVNSGNRLALNTGDGQVVHAISYSDQWYRDESKDDGGWSLELINNAYPCGLAESYHASLSISGGTPGYENSFEEPVVPGEFRVLNLLAVDSLTLRISFNRSILDPPDPEMFRISQGINVLAALVSGSNRSDIMLQLNQAIRKGLDYTIQIEHLVDCQGKSLSNPEGQILIPEKISPGDLIINEVLFDPNPGNEDFVEIYNRSASALLLSDLKIGNMASSSLVSIDKPFIIKPGAYIVLTPDPLEVQSTYQVKNPEWLIESALPAFPNDAGNITIFTTENASPTIIDAFDYSAGMHHRLLKEKEGVSLERISFEGATQDFNNWHSASESSGFGTPTYENSQYYPGNPGNSHWQVEPKTFSPDGDGFDDYMLLTYSGLAPGTFIDLRIFNAAGRLVRYLANNQSIGTEGFIQWDGSTDDGNKAPVGIYTLHIQLFQSGGQTEIIKESCVVAARLN
ncbi:MAG: lamin tail domain-containing protein [Saprospiraceae bacterium]|nr:lamin tail domain-containing protein [Saprospiraceae bacterium]